jgi:acyl dehydratase
MTQIGPYKEGIVLRSRRRTITEGDFSALINVTWENAPMHTDQTHAEATEYGSRMLGGPCIIALTAGLSTETLFMSWALAQLDIVTALGIDNVRYRSPLKPNDSILIEMHITALRPSGSRPGALVTTLHDRVLAEDDRLIMEMDRSYLLKPVAV